MTDVGRYTLLHPLGRGGMAEVSLALETGAGGAERLVVFKQVLPDLASDEQFISMFINEARISMRLNHPNVGHVYEVGEYEGQYYLVMEFIHGADLRALLRRQHKHRLTPAQSALIVAKAASALHHAHHLKDLKGEPLNIVHRDVSPQNIRISHEGIVKIIDFGVAKASSNLDITQSGVLKGKYPYMSPEQVHGLPLDGRSDLFALGVVFHEMLTYKRLFKRENAFKTLKAVTEDPIPRPREIDPDIAPELEQIVMTMLQRDRDQRYATAREAEHALEAYLRTDPASVADLEQVMRDLFGDAEDIHAQLEEALAENRLGDVFQHTPSHSLPALRLGRLPTGPLPPVEPGAELPRRVPTGPLPPAGQGSGEMMPRRVPTGPMQPVQGTAATTSDLPTTAATLLNGSPQYSPTTLSVASGEVGPRKGPFNRGIALLSFAALVMAGVIAVVLWRLDAEEPAAAARGSAAVGTAAGSASSGVSPLDGRPGAAASSCQVDFETSPAAATVSVGGRTLPGKTPATVRLPAGRKLAVRLTLAGYRDYRFDIELTPGGKRTVRHTFEPMRRAADARSPDARPAGRRPVKKNVGRPTHKPSPHVPRAGSGSGKAAAGFGRLTVDAKPWAIVYLDGKRLDVTPIVKVKVPAGRHRLRLYNPDLKLTRKLTIDVQAGGLVRKIVPLK